MKFCLFTFSLVLLLFSSSIGSSNLLQCVNDPELINLEQEHIALKSKFYTGTAKLALAHLLLLPVEYKLHEYIASWLCAKFGSAKPEMDVILGRTIGYSLVAFISSTYNRYSLWQEKLRLLDIKKVGIKLDYLFD